MGKEKLPKETIMTARKIWHYLNGRYEYFDKETKIMARMINAHNKKLENKIVELRKLLNA